MISRSRDETLAARYLPFLLPVIVLVFVAFRRVRTSFKRVVLVRRLFTCSLAALDIGVVSVQPDRRWHLAKSPRSPDNMDAVLLGAGSCCLSSSIDSYQKCAKDYKPLHAGCPLFSQGL